MPDWLKDAFEWLKASPRYFFPVAVASFALLFLPDRFVEPLGLLSLRIEYRGYVGLAFLFSSSVIACDALIKFFTWGRSKYQNYTTSKNRIRRLERLTPVEQEILRGYLTEQTRTQEFHFDNGVVNGLVHATILYPAAPQSDMFEYPFNIQPWAWDYLNEHPELVGHTTTTPAKSTRRHR